MGNGAHADLLIAVASMVTMLAEKSGVRDSDYHYLLATIRTLVDQVNTWHAAGAPSGEPWESEPWHANVEHGK